MVPNRLGRLTLVTNKGNTATAVYLKFVLDCVQYGVDSVQLREKNLSFTDLFEFGKQLQLLLNPLAIPLIINDDLTLSIKLNADGLHLGQTDGNIVEARQKLGKDKWIGLSIDKLQQINRANNLPINYIGVGSIFPTKNKPNTTLMGLDGLKAIAALSKHPIIAIGGINEHNAAAVIQARAYGIAAIGAFHETENLKSTVSNLDHIIHQNGQAN